MTRLVSAIWPEFYPFDQYFVGAEQTHTSDPADLRPGDILLVWGGEDISPSLYGKKVSRETGASSRPSDRDETEWALMKRATELNIPIIGVCRGAQMLCALAGGFLIQDVTNHGCWRHPAVTEEGLEIVVNSIHHQMMYPFDVEHELLAHTPEPLSVHYVSEDDYIDVNVEPEFVYFPKVKGFAIQWHPESMDADCNATKYIFKQLEKRL